MPWILSLLPLLFLLSCRDDFNLQGEFRDIPVIYGYLDAAEPVHYLRVERAIAGQQDTGAQPGDPEQLYYGAGEATVLLTNLNSQVTVELERIDGATIGILREEGPFAALPNILYRVDDAAVRLRPGDEVEVRVQRAEATDAVASTRMLEPVEILRPSTMARIDDYRRPLLVTWNAPAGAAVYAVQLIFDVQEIYSADPARDRTVSLTYTANAAYRPDGAERNGDQVSFAVDNEAIFRFLGQSLAPAESVTRRLTEFAVRVAAAGPEVGTLLKLADANTGLTGAQPRPRYSNVSGGEGLVTSRSTDRRTGIRLDEGSLDSLRDGRYTGQLGFR
ncbi:DUF4249 family protein [Neolewinella litorea]|uniref:DUF4249 family protein n=1 Tax=Neolewinella litorea TaxID=2562452 RepID=A0A4S4NRA5_9BACT|nr:DUF4249 family protein [Neolewinella litorea]THH41717.1 DUF4249 family protein [Neolewinella litorea]